MNLDFLPKLSTVKVEHLRIRAYIGFQKWETEKLQDLVISFSFKYDTQKATQSDNVADAVNYKKITKDIISLIEHKKFNLIEFVAEEIFKYIQKSNPNIQNIDVQVEKPHALRYADNVMIQITSSDRHNVAVIALGSNIDPKNNFDLALKHLQEIGHITNRTDFITTSPLKFEDQADFLNGAVLLVTQKTLSELQIELKQIETILGRVRTENKNAPRTIDLDVTTFNSFLIDEDIDALPFIKDFVQQLCPEALQ